eukprot:CAMPEP_0195083674 /NCGR_PEP_ID=MMETSP0448-20130528/24550_1 /TAXON_ID=66468 /ORGANISM="Heterocapsa triquestra, Strain CCMP 448" /LENGTH=52 /DNA_ID=CAMNT_0040116903 /DNA_START=182 /DNA_END=337 /DNA_ORIENTATION=-
MPKVAHAQEMLVRFCGMKSCSRRSEATDSAFSRGPWQNCMAAKAQAVLPMSW